MDIKQEIQRFKMEMLRNMPFYGDLLMLLEFQEDPTIPTAATNGKTIWYNPSFFKALNSGERNFVLMHELFHVLLRHGARNADKKRDHRIWNVACDVIINDMLLRMIYVTRQKGIPFDQPKSGVFAKVDPEETAENLYEKIRQDNRVLGTAAKKLRIRSVYTSGGKGNEEMREIPIPSDIRTMDLSVEELGLNDIQIRELIGSAIQKNRGTMGSYFVPAEIYALTESKKLDWRKLLKDFLSQELGDDVSYATPERKYLHMDMILPGHTMTEERIEEIWAFVDSSGSVGHNEMEQFLTQLYRIAREFKCIFNICYWDTAVTDVYKKVLRQEDICKCIPHHTGGTDINCVYQWIQENRVKPGVMLILTDGYFGALTTPSFSPRLGRKTILVLSSDITVNYDMERIGKIARL